MVTQLSRRLAARHPDLENKLWDILATAKELDSDIKPDDLFVYARCLHPFEKYSGMTIPLSLSKFKSRFVLHRNGRVELYLCPNSCDRELTKTFGHELKHVSQYHRGFEKQGYLTMPMTVIEAEEEAEEFETIVCDRLF